MTGIDKNFDKKSFQRVTGITKWDNYYKVRCINSPKTKFKKKNPCMVKDIRKSKENKHF